MERLLLTLIVLILLSSGAALTELPGLEAPTYRLSAPVTAEASEVADGWRRTTRGWEHVSTWRLDAPRARVMQPFLHPLTLALVQGVVSLAALLWWEPVRSSERASSLTRSRPSAALTQPLLF